MVLKSPLYALRIFFMFVDKKVFYIAGLIVWRFFKDWQNLDQVKIWLPDSFEYQNKWFLYYNSHVTWQAYSVTNNWFMLVRAIQNPDRIAFQHSNMEHVWYSDPHCVCIVLSCLNMKSVGIVTASCWTVSWSIRIHVPGIVTHPRTVIRIGSVSLCHGSREHVLVQMVANRCGRLRWVRVVQVVEGHGWESWVVPVRARRAPKPGRMSWATKPTLSRIVTGPVERNRSAVRGDEGCTALWK